eukprot:2886336-Amphidinium_carterae.2
MDAWRRQQPRQSMSNLCISGKHEGFVHAKTYRGDWLKEMPNLLDCSDEDWHAILPGINRPVNSRPAHGT